MQKINANEVCVLLNESMRFDGFIDVFRNHRIEFPESLLSMPIDVCVSKVGEGYETSVMGFLAAFCDKQIALEYKDGKPFRFCVLDERLAEYDAEYDKYVSDIAEYNKKYGTNYQPEPKQIYEGIPK